jgi:hypothetical protein
MSRSSPLKCKDPMTIKSIRTCRQAICCDMILLCRPHVFNADMLSEDGLFVQSKNADQSVYFHAIWVALTMAR